MTLCSWPIPQLEAQRLIFIFINIWVCEEVRHHQSPHSIHVPSPCFPKILFVCAYLFDVGSIIYIFIIWRVNHLYIYSLKGNSAYPLSWMFMPCLFLLQGRSICVCNCREEEGKIRTSMASNVLSWDIDHSKYNSFHILHHIKFHQLLRILLFALNASYCSDLTCHVLWGQTLMASMLQDFLYNGAFSFWSLQAWADQYVFRVLKYICLHIILSTSAAAIFFGLARYENDPYKQQILGVFEKYDPLQSGHGYTDPRIIFPTMQIFSPFKS